MKDRCVVYRDDNYILGAEDGLPYLMIDGKKHTLTCHPYEPCLYITDEAGRMTVVHNAFDPSYVLCSFAEGEIITSITGMEYDAHDFCQMAGYAAGRGNITISDAEKAFGNRAKKKNPEP